jgi:Rod binding domain-containing protein
MSIQPSAGAAGGLPASSVPAVDQALEPAWVRRGSASTQKAYQSALAFEQVLVEQLSQSLTATSGLGGESAGEGEASGEAGASSATASGPFSSMLPQALTSGVMNAGGLGLAAQMTRRLQDASAPTDTDVGATGGTVS